MAINTQENLIAWKIVREVIQQGEITSAARKFNLDPGNASRLLSSLEDEIGFDIFDRSKRPIVLTQNGKQLFNGLERLLESSKNLGNICTRIRQADKATKIRLGISTDSDPSFLFSLLEEYSAIDETLEISLIDRCGLKELQNGTVHLAYVPYLAKREHVLCAPVTAVFMISVASPHYLERFGSPESPKDLCDHVTLQRNDLGYPVTQGLWKHDFYQSISPKKTWFVDNHIALRAALEGKGIALDLPLSLTERYLKSGELVPTINEWHRQCWHYGIICNYDTLHLYPNLGNFIEWFSLKLQSFENLQWQAGYRLCGQSFPIRSEKIEF